jgi:hypothetical protein
MHSHHRTQILVATLQGFASRLNFDDPATASAAESMVKRLDGVKAVSFIAHITAHAPSPSSPPPPHPLPNHHTSNTRARARPATVSHSSYKHVQYRALLASARVTTQWVCCLSHVGVASRRALRCVAFFCCASGCLGRRRVQRELIHEGHHIAAPFDEARGLPPRV